jgi:hypothetical protein
MRLLVVCLVLASLVSVAQADITFDGEIGIANGLTFIDPDTGVSATFNWTSDLMFEDLSPFGVTTFGTGSLSTFANPVDANFITMNLTAPAGFVITGFSFDVGDFGEDLDEIRVTTLSPDEFNPLDIANTTDQLMDTPTLEGPFGFTFQNFMFERALGIGDYLGSPAVSIRAGSPGFPNSVFLDNFSFSIVQGPFSGTDDPTSGLGGGGGGGDTLTGPGGLPQINGGGGTGGTGGNGTAPEPSTLALLVAGCAVVVLRRKR